MNRRHKYFSFRRKTCGVLKIEKKKKSFDDFVKQLCFGFYEFAIETEAAQTKQK